MHHCAFDYWGKGTQVTVSSDTPASPTLFPLTPCITESGDTITLGCLAQDFFPNSATFQWTSTSKTQVDSDQYIFSQTNNNNKFTGVSVITVSRSTALSYNCSLTHPTGNKYVQVEYTFFPPPNVTLLSVPDGKKQVLMCSIENFASKQFSVSWKKNSNTVNDFSSFTLTKPGDLNSAVSILKVDKTEWDRKNVYTCEVTLQGETYTKKASKAPVTVTLNPPSPKTMFLNKVAELKCVVTGQDDTIVSKTKIIWDINGKQVKNNITEGTNLKEKTSTLTQNLAEWKNVNEVSCSAVIDDLTPITQSLTTKRGQSDTKIQVLTPSGNTDDDVTLLCLVTSIELQDYYIAWLESSGENTGTYSDGLTLPPQRNNNGYLVSSFYTIKRDKWNEKNTFSCNVWPAARDEAMRPLYVSRSADLNETIALSCMDNVSEVDDFNSLWSTTSSFIFLFIFSLSYNMLFSLVQMKKQ